MIETVSLSTIDVVVKPQADLKIPTEIPRPTANRFQPTTVEAAQQEAPWLVAPTSLPGGYELEQAVDASLAKPDGSKFWEFQLMYVKQQESGMLVRQTLSKDYAVGTNGKPKTTMHGRLQPLSLDGSQAALLDFEEVIISDSARMPALARIYVDREGILIEVEGGPRQLDDLVAAAQALSVAP